ncbi:hypothetical protein ALC57_09448 [Trachymyrmex cornetzi]|uniref:SAP domain-containing protein n=1 Tax=Trachymyrmex cornetzi TaxID=471704 RepID=A0A151J5F0_9HYME|nr:hypothetical protein ALC57_09448 [Trachymyrmex cornetzi]
MNNLAQIEPIKQKIRTASTVAVMALHKFIFEKEGDRKNRQRLRDFEGFAFKKDTEKYANKIEAARGLTFGDLISCCNILGLEYGGNKDELVIRILHGLMNLNTLTHKDHEQDDESDEDMSDDGTVDEQDDEIEERRNNEEEENNLEENHSTRGGQMHTRFSMTYRDVQDSIKTFTGKDTYPVERWIAEFEDAANLFGCAQIHEMLVKRRLKRDETLQEYILFGVKMRDETDLKLREVIEQEFKSRFEEERNEIRARAKEQILKVQSENCKTYNLRRKKATEYQVGNLVAIKRTQLGPGRKLRAKYLGPYQVEKIKPNDTYDVIKSGSHEGPVTTSTCAEYLKPWNVVNYKLSFLFVTR